MLLFGVVFGGLRCSQGSSLLLAAGSEEQRDDSTKQSTSLQRFIGS